MFPRIQFRPGEMVFCTEDLFNDGGVPDMAADGLIAAAGSCGVVVNVGQVEADERLEIYLVRFEQADGNLGPPVGCLPEELSQEEPFRSPAVPIR